MDKAHYISASEIGDFIYCKRGWWLRMRGMLPNTFAMQEGTQAHDSLLNQLLQLQLFQTILLWSGVVILVLLILLLLLL